MIDKLFVLILWPDRYIPILLNLFAAVLAGLALTSATKNHSSEFKWLLLLTAGFGFEAGSGIVRLCVEIASSMNRLPQWFVSMDYYSYRFGQLCLMVGLFKLWRSIKSKSHASVQVQEIGEPTPWPPAPKA